MWSMYLSLLDITLKNDKKPELRETCTLTIPAIPEANKVHLPSLFHDPLHNSLVLIRKLCSHDAHIRGRPCPNVLKRKDLCVCLRALGFPWFRVVDVQVVPGVQMPYTTVVIVSIWVWELDSTCGNNSKSGPLSNLSSHNELGVWMSSMGIIDLLPILRSITRF